MPQLKKESHEDSHNMHQHGDNTHTGHKKMSSHGSHSNHHARMVTDFKKRFWVSLVVTIPILILSPLIQELLGITETIDFPGDSYVLWVLSSFIFFYGGYPFLKGIFEELRTKNPGMMTLIALAIITAYTYSSAVVFGLEGKIFFWELASLIDVMLVGHWIEMRSIMGASKALEELARLMPSDAHKLMPDGSMKDVPLEHLIKSDRIIVKPGEKIPADGEVVQGETSVNEAMLTGESKPVSKHASAKVIGGSINGEGSITVEVQKTGRDSYLSQVIELSPSHLLHQALCLFADHVYLM